MKRTKDKRKETAESDLKTMRKVWKNPFAKDHRRVKIEDLSSKDVVIGVMGPTGAGKSSFIEIVTGFKGIVGHGLKSCTNEISVIKFSVPEILDADICLVDTPGFDDTITSDVDVFRMISDWLNDTYKKEIPLAGLLYFHRITDNRMAGTPLKNLRLFEKLCGKEFSTIVLTTTMWDEVEQEIGEQREQELQDIYWKSMIERGSTVKRFLYTPNSAFEVLRPILSEANAQQSLLLQKEMTDLGRELKQTAAGRALALQLEEFFPKQQKLLTAIRTELLDPQMRPDQLEKLQQNYQEVSARLQRVMADIERLKISVGERFLNVVRVKNWKGIWSMFRPKKQRQKSLFSLAMDQSTGKIDDEPSDVGDRDSVGPSRQGGTSINNGYSEDVESVLGTESKFIVADPKGEGAAEQDMRRPDAQADTDAEHLQQRVPYSRTSLQVPPPSTDKQRPIEHNVGTVPRTILNQVPSANPASTVNHPVEFGPSDSWRAEPTSLEAARRQETMAVTMPTNKRAEASTAATLTSAANPPVRRASVEQRNELNIDPRSRQNMNVPNFTTFPPVTEQTGNIKQSDLPKDQPLPHHRQIINNKETRFDAQGLNQDIRRHNADAEQTQQRVPYSRTSLQPPLSAAKQRPVEYVDNVPRTMLNQAPSVRPAFTVNRPVEFGPSDSWKGESTILEAGHGQEPAAATIPFRAEAGRTQVGQSTPAPNPPERRASVEQRNELGKSTKQSTNIPNLPTAPGQTGKFIVNPPKDQPLSHDRQMTNDRETRSDEQGHQDSRRQNANVEHIQRRVSNSRTSLQVPPPSNKQRPIEHNVDTVPRTATLNRLPEASSAFMANLPVDFGPSNLWRAKPTDLEAVHGPETVAVTIPNTRRAEAGRSQAEQSTIATNPPFRRASVEQRNELGNVESRPRQNMNIPNSMTAPSAPGQTSNVKQSKGQSLPHDRQIINDAELGSDAQGLNIEPRPDEEAAWAKQVIGKIRRKTGSVDAGTGDHRKNATQNSDLMSPAGSGTRDGRRDDYEQGPGQGQNADGEKGYISRKGKESDREVQRSSASTQTYRSPGIDQQRLTGWNQNPDYTAAARHEAPASQGLKLRVEDEAVPSRDTKESNREVKRSSNSAVKSNRYPEIDHHRPAGRNQDYTAARGFHEASVASQNLKIRMEDAAIPSHRIEGKSQHIIHSFLPNLKFVPS